MVLGCCGVLEAEAMSEKVERKRLRVVRKEWFCSAQRIGGLNFFAEAGNLVLAARDSGSERTGFEREYAGW